MKRISIMCLFVLIGLLVIPFHVNAKDEGYKSLSFKETLADEEIELKYQDYKETDDQITIYLFRGKGCGYCRAYLEFMNSISEEYGKYFKIQSYEVWHNSDNSKLMKEVANFMNEETSGVPFIIIGKKVFTGYSETYDENIKTAITDLYKTDASDRYDVLKEMEKSKTDNKTGSNTSVIVWNFIFISVATTIVLTYNNKKYVALNREIKSLKNMLKKEKSAVKSK